MFTVESGGKWYLKEEVRLGHKIRSIYDTSLVPWEREKQLHHRVKFTEWRRQTEQYEQRKISISPHSEGVQEEKPEYWRTQFTPIFLCEAFFCLYLIDAVNNQQESRERERERGRHGKGPWLRFKPGPAALNHTAYGCLFTEVNQRPIPKFNFTETCPCLGEYNRIK